MTKLEHAPEQNAQALGFASTVAGSVLLVAALFVPWAREGSGSTMSGRRLGNLVLSGALPSGPPTWSGLLPYLIAAAGGAALVGSGLAGRGGRLLRALAALVAFVSLLLVVGTLPQGWRFAGSGPALALLGLVMVALGALLDNAPSHPGGSGDRHRGLLPVPPPLPEASSSGPPSS